MLESLIRGKREVRVRRAPVVHQISRSVLYGSNAAYPLGYPVATTVGVGPAAYALFVALDTTARTCTAGALLFDSSDDGPASEPGTLYPGGGVFIIMADANTIAP